MYIVEKGRRGFVIPQEDYKRLRQCFDRNINDQHEGSPAKKGCNSYWLSEELCRQPHHPPAVILKCPQGDPTGDVFLNITTGTDKTTGAKKYVVLWCVPAREDSKALFRVACGSFCAHSTGGDSSCILECPDAFYHQEYDTGGTNHHMPFVLLIGKGHEPVKILSSYCSMNRGVEHEDSMETTIRAMGIVRKERYLSAALTQTVRAI